MLTGPPKARSQASLAGNAARILALTALLVLAPACSDRSRGLDSCNASVGTCHPSSVACGVHFECEGRELHLWCTPPATGATIMECRCVENAVVGREVEVRLPLPGPMPEAARALASTACGWPR
jgi:hypothetical protein